MTSSEIPTIHTTLLILRRGDEILLAEKKRGFGEGKYNGVGGKIDPGETSEQGMIRECQEEIGVTPTEFKRMGQNEFLEYYKGAPARMIFDLYVASKWEGEPTESEEMRPEWFSINQIPYEKMFEDDQYWLPLVLDGKAIDGYFEFDKDWNLITHSVEIIGE